MVTLVSSFEVTFRCGYIILIIRQFQLEKAIERLEAVDA
tara:strand:+ start:294 stop:410 length:117 start_codon:yes stop_codon:yes gene_type:complete